MHIGWWMVLALISTAYVGVRLKFFHSLAEILGSASSSYSSSAAAASERIALQNDPAEKERLRFVRMRQQLSVWESSRKAREEEEEARRLCDTAAAHLV